MCDNTMFYCNCI